MTTKNYNTILIVAIVSVAFGCGGGVDELPKIVEVKGKLQQSGKPVSDAEIRFMPKDTQAGSSEAVTNENGEFELQYSTDMSGAVVGTHVIKVTVYGERGPSPGDGLPGPPLAPPKEYEIGMLEIKEDKLDLALELPAS